MAIHWNALRLFRTLVNLWVILFVLTSMPAFRALWLDPVSPALPAPSFLGVFTHAFSTWAIGLEPLGIALLLVACMFQLVGRHRWFVALLIWMLYTSLMEQAWLAGSGGQQLMANVLFWLIFIPAAPVSSNTDGVIPQIAYWILRLQLLIAYLATALHKLTGTLWIDGSAMGVVAGDPAFGPSALLHMPLISKLLTWAVLFFQLTFPIAVWWRSTRLPWMIAGVIFHLATAIWLGIPEMAFAFIVCYAIWLDEREAESLLTKTRKITAPIAR